MANWIGLIVVALFVTCAHGEQEQVQEIGLANNEDLGAQIKQLQKNVTDLWTYIYQLRHAIEHYLTDLSREQIRLKAAMHTHPGGVTDSYSHHHHSDDHSGHGADHHHEPMTTGDDHHDDHHDSSHQHHDEHSSSDHQHQDSHGGADSHHHDDHHHHEESHSHGGADDHHDDHQSHSHGSTDDHHGDHHSHSHSSTDAPHSHGSTDDHHGDHHDDHHHDHHTSSDSHSGDHGNHSDSDHSKEPGDGHDDHHHGHEGGHQDSHEHKDSHGEHQDSHEHKDSHEKVGDQQSVEDIEKPFTATTFRSHSPHAHGTPSQEKAEDMNDPLNLLGSRSHHHHHHHDHHDHGHQLNETKVSIPKYSQYRQYTFATCDVQPNRVLAQELQQEVRGQVSFWQRKSGGPLNIYIRLRGFAIGDHQGHGQHQQQTNEAPIHESGHRHGFHVHEFADLSAGCQSTGPHFNPFSVNHGGPRSTERHVGDLGNIECDDHGVTNIVFADSVTSLTGQHSILGRALVIHTNADDYGMNKDDPESLRTGNAGARIACCIIQKVDKLQLSMYKAIKSATNYQN